MGQLIIALALGIVIGIDIGLIISKSAWEIKSRVKIGINAIDRELAQLSKDTVSEISTREFLELERSILETILGETIKTDNPVKKLRKVLKKNSVRS